MNDVSRVPNHMSQNVYEEGRAGNEDFLQDKRGKGKIEGGPRGPWGMVWPRSMMAPKNRTAVGHMAGTAALEAHQRTAQGNALPGDAERSERGKFEARGRPLSRGLECRVGDGEQS
ncbi:hypothetical protein NDU88_006253 [Pleurodeles waltl]|uniref:Uncharacterized protein n=1 Tax=Pleurodeles waltl TaxID=8319 RepID=A0AAV7VM93_PLEWA|nr:hypothetical protein NDU88_006253 [Pleurodeles waltl]